MTDLNSNQAADTTKIVGAGTDGTESYPAKVSPNQDLGVGDVLDNGGLNAILGLTTTPKLGVVNIDGITPKPNRKYFIMQGLDNGIKWGFTSSAQNFDLFKSQLVMIPCGPNTTIYFKVTSGTGNVAIGEVS